MRFRYSLALLLPLVTTATPGAAATALAPLPAAKSAPIVVVVLTGTACPVNTAYMPTLAKLHAEYAGKGVTFVAVNAVQTDDATAVAGHARKHGLPFAAIKDEKLTIATKLGAEFTPEAFVLDANREARYRGRI